jgi:hypothetical protein
MGITVRHQQPQIMSSFKYSSPILLVLLFISFCLCFIGGNNAQTPPQLPPDFSLTVVGSEPSQGTQFQANVYQGTKKFYLFCSPIHNIYGLASSLPRCFAPSSSPIFLANTSHQHPSSSDTPNMRIRLDIAGGAFDMTLLWIGSADGAHTLYTFTTGIAGSCIVYPAAEIDPLTAETNCSSTYKGAIQRQST